MHTARMRHPATPFAAAVGVLTLAGAVGADVVTVTADRDNTVFQSGDPQAQKSNGGGFLFSGNNSSSQARRALVHFDVASAIPASATVNGVTLTLYLNKSVSVTTTTRVHRLAAGWGEGTSNAGDPGGSGADPTPGDATWLFNFFNSSSWSTPGGDYAATPSASASQTALAGPKTWTGDQLTQDVRDWIADPSTNLGWVLVGDESTFQTARRYDSREVGTPANRPSLTIEFTPCRADFDHTGFVDTDDFDAFVHAFELGGDDADFDQSGFVDTDDFDAFVHAFEQGC